MNESKGEVEVKDQLGVEEPIDITDVVDVEELFMAKEEPVKPSEDKPGEIPREESKEEPKAKEPEEKPGEVPEEETKAKEMPEEEPKAEEEPGEKPEEKPEKEPKKEEEPKKLTREGELEEANKALREQLVSLASKVVAPPKPAEVPKETPAEASEVEEPKVEKEDVEIAFTQEEMDEALSSVEAFNSLMNQVLVGNRQESVPVPEVDIKAQVGEAVSEEIRRMELEREFYTVNPDLRGFEAFVDVVAGDIIASGKEYKDFVSLSNDIADESRKRLGMPKKEVKMEDATPASPAFPKGNTNTRKGTKPALSEMEKDIAQLMEPDF